MMDRRRDKDRIYLGLTLGTLVIGGGGIIALVYGPTSMLTSLPFLLLGSLLIWILWMIVTAVSSWRERTERDYHEEAARHIARKKRNAKKE